jgi:hypothetical protein
VQGQITLLPSPGSGAEYSRAVARMVRSNHLLEQRQSELFFATRDGHPPSVIAALRRQVASLEREYANAIDAMGRAIPRPVRPPRRGRKE